MLRFTLVALVVAAVPGRAEMVWLEAERFRDRGGWTNDAQFIDQMGSPYLLAIGRGKPVADARTVAAVARPGKHRLWVRTKNWMLRHSPGRFQVLVDGRALPTVFGTADRAGWRWQDGGVVDLKASVEVALRDRTGEYGRCDCLVLASDLAWQPPEDVGTIESLRIAHAGLSPAVADGGRHDVVVAGGGLAGCMAAVSAARLGQRTLLLQNRPVLGGNASVEILVPPVGVWPHHLLDPFDPRETGLLEEIRTAGNQHSDEAKVYSGRLQRLVAAEPNVELRLGLHVTGVEMKDPKTIAAVLAVDTESGKRWRFAGTIFIDCTGDAVVGAAAGAAFRHGRESRDEHDESMAFDVADAHTMGNSIKYASEPTDRPQPFAAPEWAMKFPRCEDFGPQRHPRLSTEIGWQWMLELGGTRNTVADAEEIRDELLRLVYGLWGHQKNHCPEQREKAANHRLAWVGHVAGKRESRRLLGDYIMTQDDIARQTLFADRIAYGAWCVDDHFPEGFFHRGEPSRTPYRGLQHSIPYRSLYSRNIDNLMMAGRNISVTHLALAATRVMLTNSLLGQAAGTAAAMAVRQQTTPRGVYEHYVGDLQQQLMKDGSYLVDLPNTDRGDLALRATAAASSAQTTDGEAMPAAAAIDGFARKLQGRRSAWSAARNAALPQWLELRWDAPQRFNCVHVAFSTKDHAAERFAIEVPAADRWRRVASVEGNRHRRHVLAFAPVEVDRLRVVVEAASRPDWGLAEVRVYDEPEEVLQIARRAMANRELPDERPQLGWDDSVPWGDGVDPRRLPGIVVDDTKAEVVGHWVRSDSVRPYVFSGYIHDANSGKGQKRVVFRPPLREAGEYEVRVAYSWGPNRASRVPITIAWPGGNKVVHLDQKPKPPIDGLWQRLGVFALPAVGTTISVGTGQTEGFVAIDAVQLIRIIDARPPGQVAPGGVGGPPP